MSEFREALRRAVNSPAVEAHAKPRAGEYTKGPWSMRSARANGDIAITAGSELDDGRGSAIIGECFEDIRRADERATAECQANARRIVACVNACEGISDEMLVDRKAFSAPDSYLRGIEAERDALAAQNRELVEALAIATGKLWSALGGSGDKENRERADRICAPFSALLAKHGR